MEIRNYSDGDQKLLNFIYENNKKSTFILSNLSIENKVVRYGVVQENIIGMYIIVNEKFITYLFADDASAANSELLISDAINYPHISGTVVNPEVSSFKQYYQGDFEPDETEADSWCELATIKSLDIKPLITNDQYLVCKLEFDRIDEYIEGLKTANVFPGITTETVKRMYPNTLTYVVWDQGKIIAGANLSVGSHKHRLVTGVFTNPSYENQGLATSLVSKLLVDNQKPDCIYSIFFTNPVAKHIYLKLGFEVENKLLLFKRIAE